MAHKNHQWQLVVTLQTFSPGKFWPHSTQLSPAYQGSLLIRVHVVQVDVHTTYNATISHLFLLK